MPKTMMTHLLVLALLECVPLLCSANTVQILQTGEQLTHGTQQKSSIMRAEITQHVNGWPRWERYFSSLHNLSFVQIGANAGVNKGSVEGDPIWNYATRHHWRGIAVEPNPNSFEELKANYAPHASVMPLQLAISDEDGTVDFFMGDGPASANEANTIMNRGHWKNSVKVPSMSLPSLWQSEVAPQLPNVDILVIDVEGAEPKLLRGPIVDPKPRFILFEYYHLSRDDLNAIRDNLRAQGYKYTERDAGDELHELRTEEKQQQ
jgi:FkbM family methyltransferase